MRKVQATGSRWLGTAADTGYRALTSASGANAAYLREPFDRRR
ncbi:hypothetical protein [Pseudofrankia saprophytica]|nr:hypothetical protein [Pseudofrankia saprophytica]